MAPETQRKAREALRIRGIGDQYAHLWSDALFARDQAMDRQSHAARLEAAIARVQPDSGVQADQAVARQRAELAQTTWDVGAYARWAVSSAWTVFERSCADAVADPEVTFGIRKRLPAAVTHITQGGASLDWTDTRWRPLDTLRDQRNRLMHRALVPADLFAPFTVAEQAVKLVRDGVVGIYAIVGKPHPLWIECDSVPERLSTSPAWVSVTHAGAAADPRKLRIVAVYGGTEQEVTVMRSDQDPWPEVESLARNVRVPLTAIRIYEGDDLRDELTVRMRGS